MARISNVGFANFNRESWQIGMQHARGAGVNVWPLASSTIDLLATAVKDRRELDLETKTNLAELLKLAQGSAKNLDEKSSAFTLDLRIKQASKAHPAAQPPSSRGFNDTAGISKEMKIQLQKKQLPSDKLSRVLSRLENRPSLVMRSAGEYVAAVDILGAVKRIQELFPQIGMNQKEDNSAQGLLMPRMQAVLSTLRDAQSKLTKSGSDVSNNTAKVLGPLLNKIEETLAKR